MDKLNYFRIYPNQGDLRCKVISAIMICVSESLLWKSYVSKAKKKKFQE